MEVLNRLGLVLLAAALIGMLFFLFIFGSIALAILFPLAILGSVIVYAVKYIITGRDDDNFFG